MVVEAVEAVEGILYFGRKIKKSKNNLQKIYILGKNRGSTLRPSTK